MERGEISLLGHGKGLEGVRGWEHFPQSEVPGSNHQTLGNGGVEFLAKFLERETSLDPQLQRTVGNRMDHLP